MVRGGPVMEVGEVGAYPYHLISIFLTLYSFGLKLSFSLIGVNIRGTSVRRTYLPPLTRPGSSADLGAKPSRTSWRLEYGSLGNWHIMTLPRVWAASASCGGQNNRTFPVSPSRLQNRRKGFPVRHKSCFSYLGDLDLQLKVSWRLRFESARDRKS